MLGSIEKGKYADMVVLNGDYMTVPENEIEKLEPVMTIVGGRWRLKHGSASCRCQKASS
jgi:predicted amidohydrolase YtcJ